MEKQEILDQIKKTALENGGQPLGQNKFKQLTSINEYEWQHHWARWGDALTEAGFSPNQFRKEYREDFVLEKLIEFMREIGRFPVSRELRLKTRNDSSYPSSSVFRRLGNKEEIGQKLIAYCSGKDGYADIVALCEPICKTADSVRSQDKPTEENIGFVYLLKSGKFYKIGRSNSLGRREYEIGIQLPEPTNLIHQIKTDDPVGVEKYWHQRFAEKRKEGEWFNLNPEDVKTFKRWKKIV
jgi:hypothetical protein